MKTLSKIIILFVITFLGVQVANGQSFLDRVKQKTKEKVEKRLDEKIDKQIDKGLDKVENSIDSLGNNNQESAGTDEVSGEAARQARMNRLMKGMGVSGEPVPIENSYSFNELVEMQIETYSNAENKTSSGEFITHLNPVSGNLAYQVVSNDIGDNDQGIFIIDTKNKAIIMLNDKEGEKTGIVYGMGTFFEELNTADDLETENEAVNDEDIPDNIFTNPNVSKTGKTKNIAGYKCEQYLYNTEEAKAEFWITDQLATTSKDFFSTLFKTSVYSNGMGYGYVMESTSEDKQTGDRSTMKVTKVDKRSHANFNLSSYQITNLGSFKMPAGTEE